MKEIQLRVFTYEHNLVQNDKEYFGALLGRVANRIGGAQFTLDGTVYKLVPNEGNNTIHGTRITFPLLFLPLSPKFPFSFCMV